MEQSKRKIPILLSTTIILGRGLTLIGWILFAFLMVFGWGFGGNADTDFLHFMGDTRKTEGRIIDVVETNAEINERSVMANVYEYYDDFGNRYVRDAFTTGTWYSVEDTVEVEYVASNPERGRVPGTRSALFGSGLLLLFLLPIIGLIMSIFGILRGVKDYSMLKLGALTNAKLVKKEPTSTSVNDAPVYKFTFEFTTENGKKYRNITKTHITEKIGNDTYERILYDTKNPTVSTLMDDIAGSPKIDADDNVYATKFYLPVKELLLPLVCVGGHVAFAITSLT